MNKMKKLAFLLPLSILILFNQFSFAQDCEGCRYISPMFDSIMVETVHFGEGMNIGGEMQQLYADVYQPYGDTVTNRPVLIFAFGGAFIQGDRHAWYVKRVCRQFAKMGYVTIANDYRIGVDPLEVLLMQHMRIFFRPMQDMRATVQYLKADFSELGNNFGIDTSKIFLGGASAGGISAMMTAYCNEPSEISEMGDISALDDLGGFDATTGFYPEYNWDVAAVVSVSGAIVNREWMEAGDVPILMAHGDQDLIVPYGFGAIGGGVLGGIFDLQGSSVVHEEALNIGMCSYLFTMEGYGHPDESMGDDYFESLVNRVALRMNAVVNDKSFCCPLEVDVVPGDTLFYENGNESTLLEAEVLGDNGNVQYQWCSAPCDLSSTQSTVTVQPDSTWKSVFITVTEGECQASNLHIVTNLDGSTSILENEGKVSVSIYPQPASEHVQVEYYLDLPLDQAELEVRTLDGKIVFNQRFPAHQNGSIQMDVSNWSSGMYLISISSEEEILFSDKLIVNPQ